MSEPTTKAGQALVKNTAHSQGWTDETTARFANALAKVEAEARAAQDAELLALREALGCLVSDAIEVKKGLPVGVANHLRHNELGELNVSLDRAERVLTVARTRDYIRTLEN